MSRRKKFCCLARCLSVGLLTVSLRAAVASEDFLLKTALDSQATAVERIRAFTDLRAVAGERSIPALVALLDDPTWAFCARSALEVMPGETADQALLVALRSASDDMRRLGLMNSLGARRVDNAVPDIAKFLASTNSNLIAGALDALGRIGSVRAADAAAAYQPVEALRASWGDSLLRMAEALRSSDPGKSGELYHAVKAKGAPPQAAAATIALAHLSEQPAVMIVDALKADESTLRVAALAVIRSGEFGPPLIQAVARVFPSLPADIQVQVLSVLYDRGDRAAAAIARGALGATDSAVRSAAAKLLSVVGDAADAPALMSMMTGAEEPAVSARLALARIPGGETTALLITAFHGGGEARAAALEVLVSRGYRPLLDDLLRPEIYADAALGRFAANAVLTLGTGADLERVLALHRTLPSSDRGPLETALRRLASKTSTPDEAAARIFSAAEKLPLAERSPLLVMLAGISGDLAFKSLSGMLASDSADTRKAALRALANWRDIRPGNTLLAIARKDPDPQVRAVAVQSATTVFSKSALGGAAAPKPELVPPALDGLRQTWKVAEDPAAKNAIISALRGLKEPKAVAAADELERAVKQRK
jgi:hypothetical protein